MSDNQQDAESSNKTWLTTAATQMGLNQTTAQDGVADAQNHLSCANLAQYYLEEKARLGGKGSYPNPWTSVR